MKRRVVIERVVVEAPFEHGLRATEWGRVLERDLATALALVSSTAWSSSKARSVSVSNAEWSRVEGDRDLSRIVARTIVQALDASERGGSTP